MLCSKFNDSIFCISSNVNKQTNKQKTPKKHNFLTFWSDANDNGDAAFELDQYE